MLAWNGTIICGFLFHGDQLNAIAFSWNGSFSRRSINFPDFHDGFIVLLREAVQPKLPEPYYAVLGRRAWVEVSERYVGADVNIVLPKKPSTVSGTGLTATLDVTEPIIVKVPHDEHRETIVEIYVGRGEGRRLVTAIEVLSPGNKTPGEKGRDLYLRKQAELLDSQSHLVEIDLLRGGTHSTAVPEVWLTGKVAPFSYHVCAHRFDNFEDYFIYPIQLADRMPTISIPLLPGDGDVMVSLQQVFERTYAAGPYHREINYDYPVPPPELTTSEQTWVQQQLTKKIVSKEDRR